MISTAVPIGVDRLADTGCNRPLLIEIEEWVISTAVQIARV
jgi:hypothetical protein